MKNNKRPALLVITLLMLWASTLAALGFLNANSRNVLPLVSEKDIKSNTEAIDINLKIPVITNLNNKKIETMLNNIFLKDANNFYKPIKSDAEKYLGDTKKNPDLHFNKYVAYSTFKTTYNKNNILSIPVRYYQYTGGANGLEIQQGYSFDLKSGKPLLLKDLFAKDFDFSKTLSTEILNQIKANKDQYFSETITHFKPIEGNHPFYLAKDNLVIFYGPFDIAPHSAGIPEFKIPYSKLILSPMLKLN